MRKSDIFASQFKLMKRLGGNLSEVWLAVDVYTSDNDFVALKILPGNKDKALIKEFFYRETESLSQVKHPNIVSIRDYAFDEESQNYWISLEYIQGKTLEEQIISWAGNMDSITQIQIMLEI